MKPPNILSSILSLPDSNEVSLARLDDIAVAQLPIEPDLLPVDPNAALLDETTRIATTSRQAGFDQGARQVLEICDDALGHVVRHLAAPEFRLEVPLRARGGFLPVQAVHEPARKGGLGVARLQREHLVQLFAAKAGRQAHVLLEEPVGN